MSSSVPSLFSDPANAKSYSTVNGLNHAPTRRFLVDVTPEVRMRIAAGGAIDS
jgi:hypothetical protein